MKNKNIQMNDLYAQYKSIKSDIDSLIKQVIQTSSFIGGPFVERLESELAKFCDTKYAVGVASGTDALYLSLWGCGISKGDEVITTPFTFFATGEAIARLGAKPVFVDIELDSFNIDPKKIEAKITKKTKAILPIHLYGLVSNMDPILKISEKYKLDIIEDACQAIGSTYKKRRAGSFGKTGCFSFYPTKNLSAWGDGGLITTNDELLAMKLRTLRNHGSKRKYHNEEMGVSSRLDGIQAAILLAKLKHLKAWNKKRSILANYYNKKLSRIDLLKLPSFDSKIQTHTFHQYTVRVLNGKRDLLKNFLIQHGIASMVYYPIPLHLLKAFDYLGYKSGDFPNSEQASQEVLSLPLYPELKEKQIDFICNKIASFKP